MCRSRESMNDQSIDKQERPKTGERRNVKVISSTCRKYGGVMEVGGVGLPELMHVYFIGPAAACAVWKDGIKRRELQENSQDNLISGIPCGSLWDHSQVCIAKILDRFSVCILMLHCQIWTRFSGATNALSIATC
ncbi:hypothetical protein Tco_1329444 [Tanacetum coccineum]